MTQHSRTNHGSAKPLLIPAPRGPLRGLWQRWRGKGAAAALAAPFVLPDPPL
jgi:hypothetical protein